MRVLILEKNQLVFDDLCDIVIDAIPGSDVKRVLTMEDVSAALDGSLSGDLMILGTMNGATDAVRQATNRRVGTLLIGAEDGHPPGGRNWIGIPKPFSDATLRRALADLIEIGKSG